MIQGYFNNFLQSPLLEQERKELEQKKEQLLQDGSFEGYPSFGTGGMREITGLGSNRLNVYNIARLAMAFAKVFLKRNPHHCKVVIAYDSRLTSPAFSRLTWKILKNHNIDVRIFKRPAPTPFLSFAVRELEADAGIVITASHNPPQYNGFKAYGSDGAQIISPMDKEIEEVFQEIAYSSLDSQVNEYAQEEIDEADYIEEEILQAYTARLRQEQFVTPQKKDIGVLYSPLHGTGGWAFEHVFKELGFENFAVLESQKDFDGNFPTVKSPNPEETSAFELLFAEGHKQKTPLLMASDPDADRIGCAVYDEKQNDYVFLNGNQIGALLLESIARKKATTMEQPFLCKTIVTTDLQNRIAESYSMKVVETLTGFKYIASEVEHDPENYLFGGEESFGYLPVNWVRDKDSISAGIAIAELAAQENLVELLDKLYIKHGLYYELLYNIKLSPEKKELMHEIISRLKNPSQLAGKSLGSRQVIDILNLQAEGIPPANEKLRHLKRTLPTATVVQYFLEPEGKVSIRPSGTEPKVKVYLSLRSATNPNPENLAEEKEKLKEQAQAILQDFIQKLGV